MSQIVIAKLLNNQTVIGKLDNLDIVDCYAIQAIQNPQNPQQVQIALLPVFAPICEDKVTISVEKIITYIEAPKNLADEYIRISSNIVMADANILQDLQRERPVLR